MNSNSSHAARRIVFVAAPGTEILDLVGPLQVFARASEIFVKQNTNASPIYSVEVVATSPQRSFVTNCGLRITAHKTFRELPGSIDTLLVAGGTAIENDEVNAEVIRWLKTIAGRIRRIGSVCTGAMLLAEAGILRGRPAITHHSAIEDLRTFGADVREGDRVVDDGDIITAAGVTSGIDLALYLIEQELGAEAAQAGAREIEWDGAPV